MSATQTFHPTQTLANDSRAQLEPWLEEFETHARNLCAQHNVTGALTLVASDLIWYGNPYQPIRPLRSALRPKTLLSAPARPGTNPHPTPTTRRLL